MHIIKECLILNVEETREIKVNQSYSTYPLEDAKQLLGSCKCHLNWPQNLNCSQKVFLLGTRLTKGGYDLSGDAGEAKKLLCKVYWCENWEMKVENICSQTLYKMYIHISMADVTKLLPYFIIFKVSKLYIWTRRQYKRISTVKVSQTANKILYFTSNMLIIVVSTPAYGEWAKIFSRVVSLDFGRDNFIFGWISNAQILRDQNVSSL